MKINSNKILGGLDGESILIIFGGGGGEDDTMVIEEMCREEERSMFLAGKLGKKKMDGYEMCVLKVKERRLACVTVIILDSVNPF